MMRKIDENKLNAVISKELAALKPPDCSTVSEWADKKRRLSPEASAEAGAWRTSRTPYLREIMDAFTDYRVRRIVFGSCSQVGKSEVMNNMIGYIIDESPGSILFIHPTTIDAKEYSKLRIAPMIRDTKALRAKVSAAKSRDSGNTTLGKTYPGGILTLCGSTEAHSLCSKPIKYIFGDEMDRWAMSAGDEGDPLELASARQITFEGAKMVEVSTPTIKGASRIESDYLKGTREHYCSQCPHCGEYSEIKFKDIRFDYEEKDGVGGTPDVKSIFYACPKCGGISEEREMKKADAKWIADNPEALAAYGIRSFWLSAFVSPWLSWHDIIIKFLLAKGDSKKLQVVYNTLFGELWERREETADETGMLERREEYSAELPRGVLCLTCGIDTQDDRLEYEVVGHGRNGETWGIKKGVIMGRPDTERVWAELDDVLDHVYKFENGKGLKISTAFMDEGGHFTMTVRQECARRIGKRLFAIKGIAGDGVPYVSPPKQHKILIDGRSVGSAWVYHIGVDSGKQLIMDDLKVEREGSRFMHYPKRDDYGKGYFAGLISERLVYKTNKNGKPLKNPWQWEKIPGHERNEPLDCRNYAIAAERALPPDYDAIERRLYATDDDTDLAQTSDKKIAHSRPPRAKKTGKNNFLDDW